MPAAASAPPAGSASPVEFASPADPVSPASEPVPVVLDCDPGHDDAIAIGLAGQLVELIGVTAVGGNVALAKTAPNALACCQLLGLDVPVHAGADRPLVVPPRHAEFIHGESGLAGPELPPLERELASRDAVRYLVDTARARDDLWIVATGPLTNVALALRAAPDIAGRLAGISLMGGGRFGNVTPAAEFNIWHDPHAAAIVFGSGVRLVMAGLDLTHQWMVGDAEIGRLRELGTAAGGFVADLLEHYVTAYAAAYAGERRGPLHDPCSVLALSHPELFERAPRHVAVETAGEHTRGMTVVDERGRSEGEIANVEMLTRIDAAAATDLLVDTLAGYR